MIPAGLVSVLRTRLETLLSESCVVRTVTLTRTADGGMEETVADRTVACRVGPLSGREQRSGAATIAESDAVVTMAYDEAVGTDDRIIVDGRVYEVTDVQSRTDALVLRVYVRSYGGGV